MRRQSVHPAATTPAQSERYIETNEVLQEVLQVFSSKEDMTIVRQSAAHIADVQAAGEMRHREMIQSIKALSGQVDRCRTEHIEREATLLDPTAKQQLLAERSRIEDNIKRAQGEADGVKQQICGAESRALELSAREQQIRQQENVEVPRARHTISLFANISSIRWDYNSPNVKGWVTSASGGGMKAFEMDLQRHTDFETSNYLWELMDAC